MNYLNILPEELFSIIISYVAEDVLLLNNLKKISIYDVYKLASCSLYQIFLKYFNCKDINWENIYQEVIFLDIHNSENIIDIIARASEYPSEINNSTINELIKLYFFYPDYDKDKKTLSTIIVGLRYINKYRLILFIKLDLPIELKRILFAVLMECYDIKLIESYLEYYTPDDQFYKENCDIINMCGANKLNQIYEIKEIREGFQKVGNKIQYILINYHYFLKFTFFIDGNNINFDNLYMSNEFVIDSNLILLYKIKSIDYYKQVIQLSKLTDDDIKLGIDKGYLNGSS